MAMEPTQLFQHFVRRPASACAAGVGVLALLALWGRECGNIGFGAGRATMEPASACLMAILGLARLSA